MDFKIEHNCPQCGGAVALNETDHLLTCPYCSTKNFLLNSGYFRYILPDQLPVGFNRGEIRYAPYLRLKGTIFEVSDNGIDFKVVDTTQAALTLPGLPPTLGTRPQAMKLRRVGPDLKGSYLRLMVKPTAILENAAQKAAAAASRKDEIIYHRAYIGETLSFIYLPLYQSDKGLMDAVLNRSLSNQIIDPSIMSKAVRYNPRWQYQFLPTICPKCSGPLNGEGDCLVTTCANCDTAWEVAEQKLQQIRFEIVEMDGNPDIYLPFWRFSLRIPKLEVKCYGDFIRLIKQPVIPKREWDRMVMSFWIPAFKVQPKVMLRIAKRMTLSQHLLVRKAGRVRPNMYPVTLTASEAKQAVKISFADCLERRKQRLSEIATLEIEDIRTTLVYIPFIGDRHDLNQPITTIAINKAALNHGRNL